MLLTLLAMLTSCSPAQAAEPSRQLTLSSGFAWVTNDPYIFRRGVQLGAELGPSSWFSVGGSVGLFPDLGEGDWRPMTRVLVEEGLLAPDISRITHSVDGFARFAPLNAVVITPGGRAITGELGLTLGAGLVRTIDDLYLIGAQGDPTAIPTKDQTHATTVFGACGQAWVGERWGVRVASQKKVYIETVSSTTLEMKQTRFLSAELLLRLR